MTRDYVALEAGQDDAWNPVAVDAETEHRLALLHATIAAVRASGRPVASLRVLDVGCGNGRSSRLYLDLGLAPEQIHGVDLRPSAIAAARRLHPGIRYSAPALDGSLRPPAGCNWIHVSTVFSSIRTTPHRQALAREVVDALPPGGFVLYFDLVHANDFAGGDRLAPDQHFADLRPVYRQQFVSWRIRQEMSPHAVGRLALAYCRLKQTFGLLAPTHEAVLYAKAGA